MKKKKTSRDIRAGHHTIKPNVKLFHQFAERYGYEPIGEVFAPILGVQVNSVYQKLYHRGFDDRQKLAIAKEFELTAQEFVDMFYPGMFHPDGNIKLDREVRYNIRERKSDSFPGRNVKK